MIRIYPKSGQHLDFLLLLKKLGITQRHIIEISGVWGLWTTDKTNIALHITALPRSTLGWQDGMFKNSFR